MCSPGKPGQEDIILLSSRLTCRERGFYAVHEWLHLCWHRDASKSPFLCGEYRFPQQDSFLEWQANEGAAEILMPWRQVVELVLECPPDPRQPGEPDPGSGCGWQTGSGSVTRWQRCAWKASVMRSPAP